MFFEDIDWKSGMLLKPQHLQSIKLSNYTKIFQILKLINNNYWGIIEMDIDTSKIQSGIIEFKSLNFINKDGSIVDYQKEDSIIFKFIVNLNHKEFDNTTNEHILYIGTIKYDDCINANDDRYYKISYGPVKDISGIEDDEYIHRLKIKPFLLSSTEIMPKFSFFPIMKVVKIKDMWSISEFWVTKLFLNIENSEIIQRINKVINILDSKVEHTNKNLISALNQQYFDYKTVITMRSLDLVANCISDIKIIFQNKNLLSVDVYSIINKLIGVLCLAANEKIQFFSQYNHEDFNGTFEPALNALENIVERVLNDSIVLNVFDHISDNRREISIYSNMFVNGKIYIQCSFSKVSILSTKEIIEQIRSLTIASESKLDTALQLRVSGIQREIILDAKQIRDIAGIQSTDSVIYMSINTNEQEKFFDLNSRLCISGKEEIISCYSFSIMYSRK